MPNFIQTCYVATDYNSKEPILHEAKTKQGKDIFKGMITWQSGKNLDDSKKYETIRFVCYNSSIFDFLKKNVGKALDIEGYLKSFNIEEKDGKTKKFWEVQIVKANLHEWIDQKPLTYFHETERNNDAIPFSKQ